MDIFEYAILKQTGGSGGEKYTFLGDIQETDVSIPATAKGVKWEIIITNYENGAADVVLSTGTTYGTWSNSSTYQYEYVLGIYPNLLQNWIDLSYVAEPNLPIFLIVDVYDGSGSVTVSEGLTPLSGTLHFNLYVIE